eukprot:CAMPEP_0119569696 /NCGR_PEP_ID=MMETSP1352-20130426/42452_1 /TAXON_ID=265584 /ORGANISM="Stauroneis constricta, Strain CCMP1120" /LENGTH=103 /DNA_ID=CAMNT_0007619291 /DNA_START=26 /DNA_END=335 /DNA_ORIENTATION=+
MPSVPSTLLDDVPVGAVVDEIVVGMMFVQRLPNADCGFVDVAANSLAEERVVDVELVRSHGLVCMPIEPPRPQMRLSVKARSFQKDPACYVVLQPLRELGAVM